ncbi:MAG: hypothetical protein CVV51_10535 [Spirochaetae bacterium HGW-Spirochaetae-7]|jgi:hypothetical protein|nr:MAG: hypothetical protein CVV51_10535 [Spirochaetae bacterium HGW-Spirochaetae-7]
MSDYDKPTGQDGKQAGGKRISSGGARQKVFNVVGWLAFTLLLPPVLAMFKLPQFQELITTKLGSWGSPVALVACFYVILFLRVFFGSDQRYTPVLLGYALSFLYFSNALDIGFMRWLYDLAHRVAFLRYDAMSLAAGVVVIFLANALSGYRKVHWIVDVLVLGVIPAGALVAAGIYLPGLLGF